MTEQDFATRLTELQAELTSLPPAERQKAQAALDVAKANGLKVRRTLASLQETLDYLRLSIKYLVFDLEATRRENGYLRKMLEEAQGGGESHGAD